MSRIVITFAPLIMRPSILLTIFMICAIDTFAQEVESIQTDRPDLTESAFTVPAGYFQLEMGLARIQVSSDLRINVHPTFLYKYGISNLFEVRLITDLVSVSNAGTRETLIFPMAVGLKIAISEEKGFIPKTAFIGHLGLPRSGTGEFSSTFFAPSFRFTMQHTLSERISLGYNLGAEWTGNSAEPIFIYTLTAALSITETLGSYVELYGFAPQRSQIEHSLDGGFTYLFNPNIQADISAGVGLTENAPLFFLSAGFSFRINTRKGEH